MFSGINYANLLSLTVSLDFFLDATFLWTIPLDAAISMDLVAESSAVFASSLLPETSAVSYFLMAVFSEYACESLTFVLYHLI